MKKILEFSEFISEIRSSDKPTGIAIFLKCIALTEGDKLPRVIVFLSGGKSEKESVEEILNGIQFNGRVSNVRELVELFNKPEFFKDILGGKILEVFKVVPYFTTPKEPIPQFDMVECTYDDLNDYDPTNMKNSDDEDSIVSFGWDTDQILSKLYVMFKSDRSLFHKIAQGGSSNIDGATTINSGDPIRPESDEKADFNKTALKKGKEDLSVLRRSMARRFAH
jgi:hypothetical protein